MLTPLQRHVAGIISELPQAQGFALAGGAAMILRGDVDRDTRDLDFFALAGSDVEGLLPVAEEALRQAGYTVRRLREGASFVRLQVELAGEVTEVDLAADARLFPVETDHGVPMLSPIELAVDKVLALFGRAEARDFVDFAAVIDRYGLKRLAELAGEKDPGFSLDVFAQMLDRFGRFRADEFDLAGPSYDELAADVARWRAQAHDLSRSLGNDLGRDRGRGL